MSINSFTFVVAFFHPLAGPYARTKTEDKQ